METYEADLVNRKTFLDHVLVTLSRTDHLIFLYLGSFLNGIACFSNGILRAVQGNKCLRSEL